MRALFTGTFHWNIPCLSPPPTHYEPSMGSAVTWSMSLVLSGKYLCVGDYCSHVFTSREAIQCLWHDNVVWLTNHITTLQELTILNPDYSRLWTVYSSLSQPVVSCLSYFKHTHSYALLRLLQGEGVCPFCNRDTNPHYSEGSSGGGCYNRQTSEMLSSHGTLIWMGYVC